MFSALSVFAVLAPVIGWLAEDKPPTPADRRGEAATGQRRPGLGRGFSLLVAARLASAVAIQASNLGVSLAMNNLGFAAAAITSTAAVGGAVSLPLRPAVGWLSDRLGCRIFLILGYLAGAASLLVFARSAVVWHFWVATCVLSVATLVEASVGQALVTDLVASPALGRGMSLFVASGWIGGTVGFAAAGHAVEAYGVGNAFALGAVLCLIATGMIISIRPRAADARTVTAPESADPPDAG